MPSDAGWGDFLGPQEQQTGDETGAHPSKSEPGLLQNRDSRQLGEALERTGSPASPARAVRALLAFLPKRVRNVTRRKGDNDMATASNSAKNGHVKGRSIDGILRPISVIGRIDPKVPTATPQPLDEHVQGTEAERVPQNEQVDSSPRLKAWSLMTDEERRQAFLAEERERLIRWVENVTYAAIGMDAMVGMTEAVAQHWDAGWQLADSGGPQSALGYTMVLDALLATPDAIDEVVMSLRTEFVAAHPSISHFLDHSTIAKPPRTDAPLPAPNEPSALGQERPGEDEIRRVAEVLPALAAQLKAGKAILEGTPTERNQEQPSVALQDAASWVGGIVNAASNMGAPELLPAELRQVWDIAGELLGERYSMNSHIAYVRMLDCLIASPEATQEVLVRARNRLLQEDPRIAAYGKVMPERLPLVPPAAPEPAVPLAVSHELDNLHCYMNPEGELEVTTYHPIAGQPSVVKWDAADTFNLAVFFGLPGVMDLIKAVHTGRETKVEINAQLEEARQAGRQEALEDAKDNPTLRRHYHAECLNGILAVANKDISDLRRARAAKHWPAVIRKRKSA